MARVNRVVDSCYKHGLTTFQEVVHVLDCDADGAPTSWNTYLVCVACEKEDPIVIELELEG